MWLKPDQFKEINYAVERGEPKSLLKLLADFFRPTQPPERLTACPQCRKPLERKMHPFLELFVHACPDRHGAWLSPEVCGKVRDLVEKQIAEMNQKRAAARRAVLTFLLAFGALVMMSLPGILRRTLNQAQWSQFKEDEIFLSGFPAMPSLQAITDLGERRYIQQTAALLEKGVSDRMLFEAALLRDQRAQEPSELFSVYVKKSKLLSAKLRAIYVPPRLAAFHSALEKITAGERAFYAALVQSKTSSASARAEEGQRHPAFQEVLELGTQARELLEKLYDPAAHPWVFAYEVRLELFCLSAKTSALILPKTIV